MELQEVTGVKAVGETPEKRQNQNTNQLSQSQSLAQEMAATSVVADTMSSPSTTGAGSQWKKPESKLQGGGKGDARSQVSLPKANGGKKTHSQKQAPQKQKLSAQPSPTKQSTLASFFQPVNKKRPWEDEPSAVMSEPKRTAPASSTAACAPTTSLTSKQTASHSFTLPVARAQSQPGSGADLFIGQSEASSHRVSPPAQQEPQGRKRKEVEAEIEMEELEFIMSEDMDCLNQQASDDKRQQAQRVELASTEQKGTLNAEEPLSTRKRQRVDPKEDGQTNQKPRVGLEKGSVSNRNQSLEIEGCISSIKRQQLPLENRATNKMSSKPPGDGSSASRSQHSLPLKDEEVSFIVDSAQLKRDICQTKGVQEIPLGPATIKRDVPVSKMDEDLPKKLVLVEFKSLTVTAPPKAKLRQRQGNCYAKNFKCFRKIPVPGSEGSLHIIGGSDLLAHNRGKNSELDEWLRDAAEEEHQRKHEESEGDDLFRYNPTKLTKRS